jgi:hypothetical protein
MADVNRCDTWGVQTWNLCEVCRVQIPKGQRWCSYEPCARIALSHIGEPPHEYRRRWPRRRPS